MNVEPKSADNANLLIVDEFMAEKGWKRYSCNVCKNIFFAKPSTKMDISVCGWNACDKGEYPFRTYTKRKKMLTNL